MALYESKNQYLTKKEFLARCANAYDMGLCTLEVWVHIARVIDAMQRLEGDQFRYFVEFLVAEQERTKNFSNEVQLANDRVGYGGIELVSIFVHPCQKCATNPQAWHTRTGFCSHKREEAKII